MVKVPSFKSRSSVALAVMTLAMLILNVEAQLPTPTEGAGYLPATLAQPSVTSTNFDPAIQNAGGTTNSAGTFDVVSLSRSSSYAGDTPLAQTTTFQPSSASYLSAANGGMTYDTVSGATTNELTGNDPTSSAMSSSTAAATGGGESDGAGQGAAVPPAWKGVLAGGLAVLAGAAWVAAS
ncbi:hypothetical protein BCV69DRAFT_280684 [Microstroma glucosiphilum]|uniref:Uncharacterized protein n=1 Tax=Pseudomicrostroma glucosiphilum TaxID=1684307 RepID=A0A316UCZ3_9BASI|nr:hypothetical protein BCV69DRAFT_280684 [Pseudomicrostroma glucosiphilum]PWN23069.1 hypothetical protein BCV69DRAFT_280684 [Pseudomicrostroma glucosiphilum]